MNRLSIENAEPKHTWYPSIGALGIDAPLSVHSGLRALVGRVHVLLNRGNPHRTSSTRRLAGSGFVTQRVTYWLNLIGVAALLIFLWNVIAMWRGPCINMQAKLAKMVGCSVDFISLVERGVNAPTVARLEKYAKVLKVEVGELFTFEQSERRSSRASKS